MTVERVLRVSARVAIPRAELVLRATRAGGAGGQHVNTSATRIELLWNVRSTRALDAESRARAERKLATRLDGDGWLRVVSSARRSQSQNRSAAEHRLAGLVRAALVIPRGRHATAPSRGATAVGRSEMIASYDSSAPCRLPRAIIVS